MIYYFLSWVGRTISVLIRPNTPYTEAVLLEVLRIGNILPSSMGQRALADGTLWDEKRKRQYFIPRGTDIIWNLGAVLKNPEYFPNPEDFDPTRSMPY